MILEPSQPAFAVFHLCGQGTAAQLSNLNAEVLINGVVTAIPSTVTNDGSGRLLVNFTMPDLGLNAGDVVHTTLYADHGGQVIKPFTVEVGQVVPPAMTQDAIATAVWDADVNNHLDADTFGQVVAKEVLRFCQWVGIR